MKQFTPALEMQMMDAYRAGTPIAIFAADHGLNITGAMQRFHRIRAARPMEADRAKERPVEAAGPGKGGGRIARVFTAAEISGICERYKRRESLKSIAAVMQATAFTIRRELVTAGVPIRNQPVTSMPDAAHICVTQYRRGYSIDRAAEIAGLSSWQGRKAIAAAGALRGQS